MSDFSDFLPLELPDQYQATVVIFILSRIKVEFRVDEKEEKLQRLAS